MKRIIYIIALLLTFSACRENDMPLPEEGGGAEVQPLPVLKGKVWVKFKTDAVEAMQVVPTRSGGVATGLSAVDLAGLDLSVYRMERVFPYGGKFEEKHRKYGLHLWYEVSFDEKIPTRSAVEAYRKLPEVETVEEIPSARLCDYREIAGPRIPHTRAGEIEMPFNDPRLSEMWHYDNRGEEDNGLRGAVAGADIGLFEAWKVETGSPEVIVAVMDGGIQFNHPDLAANMWVNEAELYGEEGVDDDNNGYVDDVYGVNFVTATVETDDNGIERVVNCGITPHNHGTHCAGTISGVTGNGQGIAGIAGGSGNGDGVRLMSCQIFHMNSEGKEVAKADPKMYIYAADMGAVISSNSWTNGTGEESAFLSSPLRTAIDYFIREAGMNTRGQQNGPMAGGTVVFAAANSNSELKEWPAAYGPNITVASMAHNMKKASYSNFGTWVDVTATGGEQSFGNEYAILSTVTGSNYAWYQGTSMACPHVSGCLALVLSKFQGLGYTAGELEERLLNATHNIDERNSKYAGKMGVGYVDVGLALTPPSLTPPETSPLTLVDAYDDWAIVKWQVKEAADGPMSKYELLWSTEPLSGTEDGLTTGAPLVMSKIVNVRYVKAGVTIQDTIRGLTMDQKYYFGLKAFDRWGGVSTEISKAEAIVKENKAPVLLPRWNGSLLIDEGNTTELKLQIREPERQTVSCVLTPELPWVSVANEGDTLVRLKFSPDYRSAGTYQGRIIVTDCYGKATVLPLPIEIFYKEIGPVQLSKLKNLTLAESSRTVYIDLSEYFQDPKGRELIYEVENNRTAVAVTQRNGHLLSVEPRMSGRTEVLVRALNEAGYSVSQRFTVEVEASGVGKELSVYPNPVQNELHLSLQEIYRGEVTIMLFNTAGRRVWAGKANIGQNGYNVDMSDIKAGTYVLKVEGENGTWTKNIIKI